MNRLIEEIKIVSGIDVKADIYDGNPPTDVVSMRIYQAATFSLRQKTAGTNTGTATMTIEACSNAAGDNPEAIAFDYYKNEDVATTDAMSAKLSATAAGFTTTANKNALYLAEIRSQDLPRGKPFVRAKLTEVVNDPVTGYLEIILSQGPKAAPNLLPSAIA